MKIISKYFIAVLFTVVSLSFAQDNSMNRDAGLLYNEGNKLIKSGQFEAALAKYNKALEIEKHPNIYYQKSITHKKLRQFDEAEEALVQCLVVDPNFSSAYSGLGTTYYSLGKFSEAITNFEKFLELSDSKKQNSKIKQFIGLSYTQLGQAAKRDGNHKQAIDYLDKAVQNYKYDAAYLTLAEIYVDLADYNKVLDAADNAINFTSAKSKISKGAPYYYKGLAFKGKKEKEKAIENFEIAKKDKNYKANSEYELKLLRE